MLTRIHTHTPPPSFQCAVHWSYLVDRLKSTGLGNHKCENEMWSFIGKGSMYISRLSSSKKVTRWPLFQARRFKSECDLSFPLPWILGLTLGPQSTRTFGLKTKRRTAKMNAYVSHIMRLQIHVNLKWPFAQWILPTHQKLHARASATYFQCHPHLAWRQKRNLQRLRLQWTHHRSLLFL